MATVSMAQDKGEEKPRPHTGSDSLENGFANGALSSPLWDSTKGRMGPSKQDMGLVQLPEACPTGFLYSDFQTLGPGFLSKPFKHAFCE